MNVWNQKDFFETEESISLPAPTLVSRFPLRVRNKAKKIKDISGPKFLDSLKTTGFVHITFLEKTLVDILDSVSTPYQRTWSAVVTDGGVLVSKQRVSALTTKDKESGGSQKIWPTPTTKGYGHGSEGQYQNLYKKMMEGEITKEELEIMTATKLENHRSYEKMQKMWPIPTVQDAKNNGGKAQHNRNSKPLNAVVNGSLNPTWVEWLMGFPIGYTDLKHSETQ